MAGNNFTTHLDGILVALTQANVAIPVIFGLATSLIGIWRAATGETVSLSVMADRIEELCKDNQAYGEAEIARLRALQDS